MKRLAWLALALGISGCERGPTPGYLRLSGAAPAIEAAPATRGTLIVFWATWCAPCVTETPGLVALAEDPPEDLGVVVLAREQTQSELTKFFGGQPPAALNLRLDPDDGVGSKLGVEMLPVCFLAVEGQLVAKFTGARDWNSKPMRALLERLVRAGPAR
ncbi:MAG: thioredoxin [Myxococcaceae bacterium]|nr:thioredoxin [Myxococcaceae bacterium]